MLLASGHDKMITQQDLLSCAMKTFDVEAMFIKINFEINTINMKHETLLQWGKVICSQQGGASLYKSIYVTRDKVAAEPASHWSILGLPRSDWLTQMVAYITLHKRAVASGGAQTPHIGRRGLRKGWLCPCPTAQLHCIARERGGMRTPTGECLL